MSDTPTTQEFTASGLLATVDNDVLKKAVCYGLASNLWPSVDRRVPIGILGAARFVLANAIARMKLNGDKSSAIAALSDLADAAEELEPDNDEIDLAATLEELAQRAGLPLDAGESQLAAITVSRDVLELQTGDKRAIEALDHMLDHLEAIAPLVGRVHCLEQLIVRLIDAAEIECSEMVKRICSEPHADKSLSICFSCNSGGADEPTAREGLASYIEAVRRSAPRLLAA